MFNENRRRRFWEKSQKIKGKHNLVNCHFPKNETNIKSDWSHIHRSVFVNALYVLSGSQKQLKEMREKNIINKLVLTGISGMINFWIRVALWLSKEIINIFYKSACISRNLYVENFSLRPFQNSPLPFIRETTLQNILITIIEVFLIYEIMTYLFFFNSTLIIYVNAVVIKRNFIL